MKPNPWRDVHMLTGHTANTKLPVAPCVSGRHAFSVTRGVNLEVG